MNNIFMNSENSKTADPHRLLLNLTNKKNRRRNCKYVALSNLSILDGKNRKAIQKQQI